MDWLAQVDAYCERTDLTFWSEPINALTNLGYLIVGLWFLGTLKGVPYGRALAALLIAISIGSFLFHTLATTWAGLADSLPIGLFILLYLFAINRLVIGWPVWAALLGMLAFIPFAAAVVFVVDRLPFFAISNFYWSVPILMAAYAFFLRESAPNMVRTLWIAAALLTLSITARSFDELICQDWPLGTHFAWHLINSVMFVVVLSGYRAHALAAPNARR